MSERLKRAKSCMKWTPDDREYLADHYGLACDKTLAARLQRSESAIAKYAATRRIVMRRDNFYTAAALAQILEIPCPKQITRWVEKGWLKGRRAAKSQGRKRLWHFSERGIVRCLKRRPWLANFRLMEQHYFRSVVIKEWQRDPWYTVEQAAPMLGLIKPGTVYRYIYRGWLRAERRCCEGTNGHVVWIIRRSDINAFLENVVAVSTTGLAHGRYRKKANVSTIP